MWIRKLFFSVLLLSCGWLQAQTVWPAVQSNMYPHIPFMKLVRHEQTVLLGEGNQQTGIFYASLADTYSEQVSNELINDALLKSWSLHSLVRLGTSFVLTFVQDTRILDRSNFSKLFTMTDLIGSVGSGTYQANQADMSLLNGTESTNALLQKMLEEGRLVVQ